MVDFARESLSQQLEVAAGAAVELTLGPTTPGEVVIAVEAYAVRSRRRPVAGQLADPNEGGGIMPQNEFLIEVLGQQQTSPRWSGRGPLTFTIPPRPAAAAVAIVRGTQWRLRVTNTTTHAARGFVNAYFAGERPIAELNVNLDEVNARMARTIERAGGDITVKFENRTHEIEIAGRRMSVERTWFVPDGRLALVGFSFDATALPAKVVDRDLVSAPMKFKVIVNDGRVALKTRIDFPYGANFLIENLLGGIIDSGLQDYVVKRLLLTLVPSQAKIRTLSADIILTLRDVTLSALFDGPATTCDVTVRPYIQFEGVSGTLTTVLAALIEGLVSRAYDPGNPLYAELSKVRAAAETGSLKLRNEFVRPSGSPEPIQLLGQVASNIRLLSAGDARLLDPR